MQRTQADAGEIGTGFLSKTRFEPGLRCPSVFQMGRKQAREWQAEGAAEAEK